MTWNPHGLRSLAKHSKLLIERIDYRPDADEAFIGGIERGNLFLMAFWSGPSVTAFKKLTEAVARIDTEGELELMVVDADGSPALYKVPESLARSTEQVSPHRSEKARSSRQVWD